MLKINTSSPLQPKNCSLLCVTPTVNRRLPEWLDPAWRHQTQKKKGSFHIHLFTFVCTWLLIIYSMAFSADKTHAMVE